MNVLRKIKAPNAVLFIGTSGFLLLYYNKLKMEQTLKNHLISSSLDFIRKDSEIMEKFGHDFKIRTNILSTAKSVVKLEGPFGEARYNLRTPNGDFSVTLNGSSQKYDAILNSSKPILNKAKYSIPEQNIVDQILSVPNPENLKVLKLDPTSKFWAIDFINIVGKNDSFVRKPSVLVNTDTEKPAHANLWSIFQDLQVK